jgi:hypothetical protein
MVVRRIGAVSVAKMAGALYAIGGLLAGLMFSLVSLIIPAFIPEGQLGAPLFAIVFGVGAVVILPLLYGLVGFIMALIAALLYNALAGLIGGVQLELENEPPSLPGVPIVGPGS